MFIVPAGKLRSKNEKKIGRGGGKDEDMKRRS
jgi:hypothetical protein